MKLFQALAFLALANAFTDWQLLGHNNFRFRAKTSTKGFKTSNPSCMNFHYTRWDVPFGASADLNGGAAQRTDDGHIFLQLLGTTHENMGSWVGAEKEYGPPFVWEIDGNTGQTVQMYNLSGAGDVFESPLRFTPSGNPMVAVQSRSKGYRIVVLDRSSNRIAQVFSPPIEPLLVFPANTDPPSAVMASMNEIATVDFDSTGQMLNPSTKKATGAISTIIFGVDGKTMYNGAVNLESAGIYRYKLPIHGNGAQKLTSQISPYPWQTVNDAEGNVYGLNGGRTKSFDNTGKMRWETSSPGFWLAMSDDESMVFAGDSQNIAAMDATTGTQAYKINIAKDLRQASDTKFSCMFSEQPWAPRHPLILVDGRMAVLCRNQENYFMGTFNLGTGKVSMQRSYFNMTTIRVLTGDSANNVFAYGADSGVPVVQKISV